jgi:hypothetical protein
LLSVPAKFLLFRQLAEYDDRFYMAACVRFHRDVVEFSLIDLLI